MNMRKFGLVAALTCAVPVMAAPNRNDNLKDKEVWITIGADALAVVKEALLLEGQALAEPVLERDGVVALRVRQSQMERVSEAIHGKLHRCAGFVGHDSQEEAVAAVNRASAPQAVSPLAVSYLINNSPSVNALVGQVRELNIRNTINSLSTNWTNRHCNSQSGVAASTWLKDQWTNLGAGRSDVTVEQYAHTSWLQPSVIATITGSTHPTEVVVIGGHLDSIAGNSSSNAAPGADDDASGVSSITEIFRAAMATGYKPARTVKFMAYAAEETGLNGSKVIANAYKASAVNVVGVLQLDMTNYKGSTWDFAMVTDNTNAAQNSFVTSLISTYLPGKSVTNITCGYGCSDHASWTAAGYPSSMPFEATMTTDNPYIHTANDTLSVTSGSAENSVKFAQLGAAFMAELAKGATTGNTPPPVEPNVAQASFDSTYKAPRCSAAASACDSGTLLKGRGGVGPETNKPNTLQASCTDGTAGTYLKDESNERIKVSSVAGTNMAAGKQVKVEATVYAFSTTKDKLDLYYTASVSNPTWKLIGTYAPANTGMATISATYTLPTGSIQAVRARFRYDGSAAACGAGDYNDHDDLIFAVQ